MLGLFVGQAILFAPSLAGRKILLPLDLLADEAVYLPATSSPQPTVHHDFALSDLVLGCEPIYQFGAAELRAGRWPAWDPYQFAGARFAAPMYSPYLLFRFCIGSPIAIAWLQVILALVTGSGVYCFCRHALGTGWWPAAIAAWCWPLSGALVLWQGNILPLTVSFLPWILLAVHQSVRRPGGWSALGLALATLLVLVSGHLAIAAQVLLASGFYAVWCFLDACQAVEKGDWLQGQVGKVREKTALSRCLSPFSTWRCLARRPLVAVISTVAAWGLGFALAAPYLLPTLEYNRTGLRMARRSEGAEERPPVGLAALPQTVLPDMYGSNQTGSLFIFPIEGNQLESSAQTYTGLLATLLVAPLAWCSRRHRSINVFWALLGFFALSWTLNLPGLVWLLRLPPLNMLSYNRFVFAASFAILAMMAVGLELLCQGRVDRRWWFFLPAAVLAGLASWCVYRTFVLPVEITTSLESAVRRGEQFLWVQDMDGVRRVQTTFIQSYAVAAGLCCLGLAGWLWMWFREKVPSWFVPLLGALLAADLLWFAYGRSPQCDPSLYYPPIPVLEQISKSSPGRILGGRCLPANLGETHRLPDVRGYDGVDPARFIDLMMIAASSRSPKFSYAMTQWYEPEIAFLPSGTVRLHPILDMLNVRYLVIRGSPPPGLMADFSSSDYWVLINHSALPRAFVPERVEMIGDDTERLKRMASRDFNAAALSYVETPVSVSGPCQGSAQIIGEVPTRVSIAIDMKTPGLVVLADRWDAGWKAYLDGKPKPILVANHALRGVEVPAGAGTLEFRYEPDSVKCGWWLSGLACIALAGWSAVGFCVRRGNSGENHVRRP
jgi:hypothetical protein